MLQGGWSWTGRQSARLSEAMCLDLDLDLAVQTESICKHILCYKYIVARLKWSIVAKFQRVPLPSPRCPSFWLGPYSYTCVSVFPSSVSDTKYLSMSG